MLKTLKSSPFSGNILRLTQIAFLLFLFLDVARAQSTPLPTDRARIVIATIPDAYDPSGPPLKVLRTDTNSPLRAGTVWIWEKPPQEQPESYYASMRAKGLNSVRMILFDIWETEAYTPGPDFTPTDWNDPAYRTRTLARMERSVNFASVNGMYVIINLHNKIPHYNAVYADALWTHVAPYFANRTHVIYEAANEPMNGIGRNGDMEAELPGRLQQLKTTYNIIRAGAPNTHVMILSPPGVNDFGYGTGLGNLAEAFAALPGTVDWTKTSVAYHLYSTDGAWLPQAQNLRNLHSRFAGWPSENNFPSSISNETLGITDTWRSGSFAGHEHINQTCEFLGLGWSMWNINGQEQLDRNWPILWADAVAKGYAWTPDVWVMPPPAFISPIAASILQGFPTSVQLAASPGTITYGATGLPAGLSLNGSTGLVSGTALVAGVFNIPITATNSAGSTAAILVLTVSPATESTLYSETFSSGGTGGWWSYSGGTGVTSTLTNESAGTTDGRVLRLALQGSNSWYAGIGTTQTGLPPFTPSTLDRTVLRARVRIQSPAGQNFAFILKSGTTNLYYNTSATGAVWTDFSIPLSSFTNTGFDFTASSWEILLVPDSNNWGLGNVTLKLDHLSLIRVDAITPPLHAWRQLYFSTTANAGDAANTADADGDGLNNLLEYALGGNPTLATSAPAPVYSMAGDFLTLTFQRVRADVAYRLEVSGDLITWATLATNPGTVGQTVVIPDTIPVSTGTRRFMRLVASVP